MKNQKSVALFLQALDPNEIDDKVISPITSTFCVDCATSASGKCAKEIEKDRLEAMAKKKQKRAEVTLSSQ